MVIPKGTPLVESGHAGKCNDGWRPYRCRDVHGATVHGDNKAASLEEGAQFLQRQTACEVEVTYVDEIGNLSDEVALPRASCKHEIDAILINQLARHFRKPLCNPQLRFASSAGMDRHERPLPMTKMQRQQLIYTSSGLRGDGEEEGGFEKCLGLVSGMKGLCNVQTPIDFVLVLGALRDPVQKKASSLVGITHPVRNAGECHEQQVAKISAQVNAEVKPLNPQSARLSDERRQQRRCRATSIKPRRRVRLEVINVGVVHQRLH